MNEALFRLSRVAISEKHHGHLIKIPQSESLSTINTLIKMPRASFSERQAHLQDEQLIVDVPLVLITLKATLKRLQEVGILVSRE